MPNCLIEIFNAKKHIFYYYLVCALPSFKKKGFHFSETAFNANVFSLEEIFEGLDRDDTLFNHYSVSTVNSLFYGRCYSLTSKYKLPVFYFGNRILLKTKFDVNLYIHTPGKYQFTYHKPKTIALSNFFIFFNDLPQYFIGKKCIKK